VEFVFELRKKINLYVTTLTAGLNSNLKELSCCSRALIREEGVLMAIEFRSETRDSSAVIYCSGEVRPGEEGHRLRETVISWLRRCRQVTVDLSNIRYMNSGGLGILVSLYPIARSAGATLKYVNLVAPVDHSRASLKY
jgi:anti-sigma B factor antagonist